MGLHNTPRSEARYDCGPNLRTLSPFGHVDETALHPKIGQKVWATFMRGDYDTAIFQAFKEVEVQVREAAKLADTDIAVRLMRKAFETANGPLCDSSAPVAEREALGHLFAGAIGCYKNPHSHRTVTVKAEEAVEIVMLASHLLGIVDRRSASVQATA